jgi:hypothetical protein
MDGLMGVVRRTTVDGFGFTMQDVRQDDRVWNDLLGCLDSCMNSLDGSCGVLDWKGLDCTV